jgi:hypothetical protein
MTAVAEIEATAVHAPGTDLTPYAAPVLEEYRARFVMAPEEAAELDEKLRSCMRAILKDGVDFGTIPGAGDKKNLLKPGAEKLLQWFGFGFTNEEVKIERDDPEYPSGIADKARRIGVTYRCTVFKQMPDGRKVTVATCEAYAGYDEDRYYISAEDARAKAETKERMWADKDKRQPNPKKWEFATEYRAPWNTVVKMCEKRSLVGAAIDATAAAGLFTQDLEDMKGGPQDGSTWTEAAEAKIMALPDDARDALDAWYRGRKWPDPRHWTPEQWCEALMAAGTITARQSAPAQTAAEPSRQPAPQPARPAPAPPSTDEDWFGRMQGRIATVTGQGEWRGLWAETVTMTNAGKCSREDAKRLQDMLRARADELSFGKTSAFKLDDSDPWYVKIRDAATTVDTENIAAELAEEQKAGRLKDPRLSALRDVLAARAGEVAGVLTGTVTP